MAAACLLALTLVALQGGGLGTELPEHSLYAPLQVQLCIWREVVFEPGTWSLAHLASLLLPPPFALKMSLAFP